MITGCCCSEVTGFILERISEVGSWVGRSQEGGRFASSIIQHFTGLNRLEIQLILAKYQKISSECFDLAVRIKGRAQEQARRLEICPETI